MRTLIWSNAFTRSFKGWMRKRPDLNSDIAEALRLLLVNPFAPQLETHKLRGGDNRLRRLPGGTQENYPCPTENQTGNTGLGK